MFDFLLEKMLSGAHWEEVKFYKNETYENVLADIEKMFGKCHFRVTDIDSPITNIKPHIYYDEYRLISYSDE